MSTITDRALPVRLPDPVANGGRLGMFALQVRTEVVSACRNVEYIVGLVAIPALLYAMFGLSNDSAFTPGGAPFSTIAIGSFGAYGVVSLAIFTFGDEVAKERGRGWLRTRRATPLPAGAYLVGKLSMAAAYAVLITFGLALISVPTGRSQLTAAAWLALGGVLIAGVLAFSTLGLSLAYLVRPKAAATIANLVFLPLSFCSGFFFPLSELPGILRDVAPFLPTYHFGQLVWRIVATEADAAALTGLTPRSVGFHVAWVAGCTVVGAVVTLLAARREAVTRRA